MRARVGRDVGSHGRGARPQLQRSEKSYEDERHVHGSGCKVKAYYLMLSCAVQTVFAKTVQHSAFMVKDYLRGDVTSDPLHGGGYGVGV